MRGHATKDSSLRAQFAARSASASLASRSETGWKSACEFEVQSSPYDRADLLITGLWQPSVHSDVAF